MSASLNTLVTLRSFVQQYPGIASVYTLRHWIQTDFHGFRQRCAFRPGGQRYLVDVDAVQQWMAERGCTMEDLRDARQRPHYAMVGEGDPVHE